MKRHPRARNEPSQLPQVLPIAVSARQAERTLTLLSLELYADSFIANLLLEEPPGAPHAPSGMQALNACDDAGGAYVGRPRGGYGGGGPAVGHHDRMIYEFSPALRPDARSLTFLGTPVSGMRSDGARGHRFDPDQVLGPAWSATLSLPNRTTPDGA